MTKQQDFSMWSMNFILFCLANFLYYGAFYLYIPVLPQYVEMLGGTPADIGLVGGAFGLSSFIIRPYLGKLANEWGRKRMMLLGTISFALLFLLFGRVTGVVPLVVLRLAHGVCLAMYLAASAAYIADYAPVGNHRHAQRQQRQRLAPAENGNQPVQFKRRSDFEHRVFAEKIPVHPSPYFSGRPV